MSGAINEIFRYLDFLPVQMTKYSVILLRFVTEAMSMLVNEGETVRVPCTVDRLEGFVLLWKQKVQYCTILYCSRTFNWRSYCLALCDECLDRFPLFDETLHHIELSNSGISQIQRNPPSFSNRQTQDPGSTPTVCKELFWKRRKTQNCQSQFCNIILQSLLNQKSWFSKVIIL